MNRNNFIEQQEHKQSRNMEHQIMDQYYVNKQNADKAARDAKTKKIVSWVSTSTARVAAITGVIALLK
ncbi:hypothetical protein [Chitinophaga sp. OAE865]|uniref:hypothetical protein n=1 Tax=Chitinophaga sp. OAE865 TaxID=2817898 RepID=UPI001AE3FBC1